jgi:hypothetical protein
MRRERSARFVVVLVLALLLVAGIIAADRAIMGRLGVARGTLVAAVLTGFVFFVVSVLSLEWMERRPARRTRTEDDPDAS